MPYAFYTEAKMYRIHRGFSNTIVRAIEKLLQTTNSESLQSEKNEFIRKIQ